MEVSIRLATKNDMTQVLDLIKELALFEREPDAVEVTVNDLKNHGFVGKPEFTCFVAEKDDEIQGMALVFKRYSTWKGIVLHLEDLIVKREKRGLGIGNKLLDTVVNYGKQLGVKRISWEVLDWNQPAIDFYHKKGAKMMDDWRVVHLDEQGIENYLAKI